MSPDPFPSSPCGLAQGAAEGPVGRTVQPSSPKTWASPGPGTVPPCPRGPGLPRASALLRPCPPRTSATASPRRSRPHLRVSPRVPSGAGTPPRMSQLVCAGLLLALTHRDVMYSGSQMESPTAPGGMAEGNYCSDAQERVPHPSSGGSPCSR